LASNRDDSFILASQIDAQGFQLAPFSPTAALASVVSAQFRRANPLNNDQNLQAFAAMQQPFRPQVKPTVRVQHFHLLVALSLSIIYANSP
jgi:hypothetical protein